jgi:murein DD-endopeptidase MepM/ murein hydrolase activator NlpD
MERYSLIVVTDVTAPSRRFEVSKLLVKRAAIAAALVLFMLMFGLVDYVNVRSTQDELHRLRGSNAAQHAQIDALGESLANVKSDLERLSEFERKVRIIANLPGSAASGVEDIVPVGSDDASPDAAEETLPVTAADGRGGDESEGEGASVPSEAAAERDARVLNPGDRVSALEREVERLGLISGRREISFTDLLAQLEEKHQHLASTPAIWPAKGWLTSRFGNRISPFTGAKQFHGGIDIAGRRGTDVIAPARGKVAFAGKKGGLGRAVKIDHGYGIRTVYGHNDELFVKVGQEVERGQRIASLGSTGRSTGPHLHYAVEVKGKAVNPLDYIFD